MTSGDSYRFIVVGDRAVGKTALVRQFCHYHPTMEEMTIVQATINGRPTLVEILDTGDGETKTSVPGAIDRDVQGFILVYSITSRSSFEFALNIIRNFAANYSNGLPIRMNDSSHSLPIVLIGNKRDQYMCRAVSTKEGEDIAQHYGLEFYEISSRSYHDAERVFSSAVRRGRLEMKARQGSCTGSQQRSVGRHECQIL
ncbi:ras family domain-containing protein [Purpureocillium lilacinum]|uniref:small monomeric GTPase n=1 Tax=Purpureocillium lilacinum TaxID=33203 RepID=A0A179FEH2_PURLI|nr:ras family domain-containing protein [Purpureocillium lilacinum]